MAQTLEIRTKKDTVQLVLDGHEIHDVVSYQLEESPDQLPVLFQFPPPERGRTRPLTGAIPWRSPAGRVVRAAHKVI